MSFWAGEGYNLTRIYTLLVARGLSCEEGIKFDYAGEWKENLRPINAAMLCWEEETVPSFVCILLLDLYVIKDCFPFWLAIFRFVYDSLTIWSSVTKTLLIKKFSTSEIFGFNTCMIGSVIVFNCANFVFGASCEGSPSVLFLWFFNKQEKLHCY